MNTDQMHSTQSEKDGSFHVEQEGLEHVELCPICSSDKRRVALNVVDHTVSQGSFTLNDCSECGFRFTDPRPSQTAVGAYYKSPDYISHTNAQSTLQDRLYQVARKRALRQKFGLIQSFQPRGKVLDIGCGTGEFLAGLKGRGYTVQGVEPDVRAREQATSRHGIPVEPGLDKIPLQEQFHVVTLWHVLEHLPDLRGFFKKLYALTADSGLVVIAVPDRESWDASFYKENWAAYDVPRHFSHFRQKDVKRLIHEHGFEMIETRRMWLDAFYIALLSSKYGGSGSLTSLVSGMFVGGFSNAISLFTGCPTSSTLYIAKKGGG